MANPEITGKKFIGKREVALRYGVAMRTIERWVEKEFLPPSDLVVNHRHYWEQARLEQHDRQRVVEHAASRLEQQQPAA